MSDFKKLWDDKPWWPEGTTDKEMAKFYYEKGIESKTEPVAKLHFSDGLAIAQAAKHYKGCMELYAKFEGDGRSREGREVTEMIYRSRTFLFKLIDEAR